MAGSLRQPLNRAPGKEAEPARWLAVAAAGVMLLPLVPGLFWTLGPACRLAPWQSLLGDGQLPMALATTCISALGSSLLALLLAWGLAMCLYPRPPWRRVQRQLPVLLAFPHVAFGVGLAFLLAPAGWIARWLAGLLAWDAPPEWVTVQDPHGIFLLLALALKECWFLLWALAAILGETQVVRLITVAASLGYGRRQIWSRILLPQLLPRLAWPLAAVLAYGLSVVDMALILGPSTPPTLAVLGWQWLSDPDPARQAQGSAAAGLLVLLLVLLMLLIRLGWWAYRRWHHYPTGDRQASPKRLWGGLLTVAALWPGWLALGLLLLWSVAGPWFFPAPWPSGLTLAGWQDTGSAPVLTALWLGLASVCMALPLVLFWLEWGPQGYNGWLYLPLILPALPLAAAQYGILLLLGLDGTGSGVVWSHLTWVLPYMLLMLAGPYRAFDPRIMTTARALGYPRWQVCLRVKWPLLLRPILAALAVGFAVSIAQYLPTLFAGGGRFATVTTEAVALSAGGDRRLLAVQAVWQTLLPLLAFALAALVPRWRARRRQGLR